MSTNFTVQVWYGILINDKRLIAKFDPYIFGDNNTDTDDKEIHNYYDGRDQDLFLPDVMSGNYLIIGKHISTYEPCQDSEITSINPNECKQYDQYIWDRLWVSYDYIFENLDFNRKFEIHVVPYYT
jgi:hypothetical protein